MTFFRKIAALSFLALEAYPSAAFALPMAFAGSWSNVNPAARGLSRVTVDNSTNGRIRLLGACHPQLCDWGWTEFDTYGGDVSDKNHLVGTAHFSQPHAEREIVARLVKDGTLQLETFTNFNDASGRENYSQVEVFKRVSEAQPAP